MAAPTMQHHLSPLDLLIDFMETMSDDKVREMAAAIDWGAPEVRVLRSRSEAALCYGSKLDVLIERASEHTIGLVLEPTMLDHVGDGERVADRRARTRWGVDFMRNSLWGSACMQSLHEGKTSAAQKCLDAVPNSRGSSWLQSMAKAGAQGGHPASFSFLLSDALLERFAMIKAPADARKTEIKSLRDEVISVIALHAPLNKLKALAGLLGGQLTARCVSDVSRRQDKPHRAFAVAKFVDMEQSNGGSRSAIVDMLAIELLNKSTSAGVFSPKGRWLLAQCPLGKIEALVDHLADGSRYWDHAMLDVVRQARPVPGPVELERLMTQGSDGAWAARLDDALKGWNSNDFRCLRDNLEKADMALTRSEHMEACVLAARLASVLGAEHGCPRFEGALVDKQSMKQHPDCAQAVITQAIMGETTTRAGADHKVRRI